jgi:hypothetical protein
METPLFNIIVSAMCCIMIIPLLGKNILESDAYGYLP